MKKRKSPKAKSLQPNNEAWRRFYMSEDEVEITPAPQPKTVRKQ